MTVVSNNAKGELLIPEDSGNDGGSATVAELKEQLIALGKSEEELKGLKKADLRGLLPGSDGE